MILLVTANTVDSRKRDGATAGNTNSDKKKLLTILLERLNISDSRKDIIVEQLRIEKEDRRKQVTVLLVTAGKIDDAAS